MGKKKRNEKEPASYVNPMPGESPVAFQAFTDYCTMGTRRSLRKLLNLYQVQAVNGGSTIPPTLSFQTMGKWSNNFKWQARVKEYDEDAVENQRLEVEKRRQQVIDRGFSDYEKALRRYDELLERVKLHSRRQVTTVPDPETGGMMKVITLAVTPKDELAIAKMRREIELLGRAAAGLPPDNRQLRIGNIGDEALNLGLEGLADELAGAFSQLQEYRDKKKAASEKTGKKRRAAPGDNP